MKERKEEKKGWRQGRKEEEKKEKKNERSNYFLIWWEMATYRFKKLYKPKQNKYKEKSLLEASQ